MISENNNHLNLKKYESDRSPSSKLHKSSAYSSNNLMMHSTNPSLMRHDTKSSKSSSQAVQEEAKEMESSISSCENSQVDVNHYEIMLVVNPSSGSERGRGLLQAYNNTQRNFYFRYGLSCNLSAYNVLEDGDLILKSLSRRIQSNTLNTQPFRQKAE